MHPSDAVGFVLGFLLTPFAALGSKVRKARVFHPDGTVYRAKVSVVAYEAPFEEVGRRLEGGALVRLSTAWWRGGKEWIDVLGCAVRFCDAGRLSPRAEKGDQDLLFATVRSALTLPFAPITTHQHDFLDNLYFAVGHFEVKGVGKIELRLSTRGSRGEGSTRTERLRSAVERGEAVFRLEGRKPGGPWTPLVAVELESPIDIDQNALRFSPFRTGRGVVPRGTLQALRIAPYWISQKMRPEVEMA
jgi:hypothetical protein